MKKACREAAEIAAYRTNGWSPSLQSELDKLTTSSIAKLPVAVQRIAFLDTLISLADRSGDLKKIKGGGNLIKVLKERRGVELADTFSKTQQLTLMLISKSLEDIKKRITDHLHRLDKLMSQGFIDIKHRFALSLNNASADIMGHNPNSWFNQAIFPAVLMAGKKRLPDIKDDQMARTYCQNLLLVSGMFNSHYSAQNGTPSLAKILHGTYETMVNRVQKIYFALN